MIVNTITMKSAVLQNKAYVTVLLPETFDSHAPRVNGLVPLVPKFPMDQKYKVLTLLHGAWDDGTSYLRRTNIEKVAEDNGFAVVLPSIGTNFYTDCYYGDRWYTFVTEELPQMLRRNFPLSDKKEDNVLAGLSMGGYGTMMIGLKHPERYAKLATMSGALNLLHPIGNAEMSGGINAEMIWGGMERYKDSEWDVMHLLDEAVKSGKEIPPIFQVIGTADPLYPMNQDFREKAEGYGLDLHYEEVEGMGHDWVLWNEYVTKICRWAGLAK
ncbi:MAG: esterase family protein [Lachnospiraceae bacterium]|nr:esterase family protein [Lachnospiraceae bacterium]